ncbi:MAG: peptidoglycan bridge formation glycyltransferase FemA/FemB family protein [Clostridia bacterium]|jgi:lipid II:glycine glycyltransferase (peptidoglycan interpeptide bridge formation enzyme)|nr:peptidoglycan bridge formation glycyltransferase FemA/FemB family protein [Clostridia bacterium]
MRFVTKETEQEYKKFLENHERCNFQQSLEWAKVKSSWTREVVLAEDENKNIIGSICILIRKIPIFGNMMYSSRGPVCDIHDKAVLEQLTEGVKEIAKKYNAFVFRMEPDIKKDDAEFRKIVEEIGYKVKDDAKDFKDEIQPRFVFRLDIKDKTEDEIMKNFHQKTRYNIRLATKKGVVIKEGTRDDLKEFHKIMIETGSRDGFIIRPLEYFEKMYDELAPKHMKLLMAYHEDKPISGIIPIMYGNKTWYLYGASSNSHRNLMPNYLLQWEMIKQAIANKCDMYDFRGVSGVVDENHPQYGLYRFKKGFGAEFTEFIGEVYLPFKPLTNRIYKFSEKTFRTLRNFKRKLTNDKK